MSLESWKAEFYPVTAHDINQCASSGKDLVSHSLTKWMGLTAKNLQKHGLYDDRSAIIEKGASLSQKYFYIDGESCSLCVAYYRGDHYGTDDRGNDMGCTACPIYVATGKSCRKAYRTYTSGSGRPTSMINLLKKTLAFVS